MKSTGKVAIMELQDEAGRCKGTIGKNGNKWLMEQDATVESCQLACLNEEDCKYATLTKTGNNNKKWKCASFKKCTKRKKDEKYMIFKKSKVKESEAESRIWIEGSTPQEPRHFFLIQMSKVPKRCFEEEAGGVPARVFRVVIPPEL